MNTLFKLAAGGAILGTGAWLFDKLYDNVIEERLPEKLQRSFNDPGKDDASDAVYYGLLGVAIIAIVPPLVKLTGLSGYSPIKPDAAPVKV